MTPWDLSFDPALAKPYKSPSQRVRVMSEAWLGRWMFCPNCGHRQLEPHINNQPDSDFHCPACLEQYELKSAAGSFVKKLVDGAYQSMIDKVSSATNPNLLLLEYIQASNTVSGLAVVPKQFFTAGCIEPKRALGPAARRAGWIGCNILLSAIPRIGIVPVVEAGRQRPQDAVRKDWAQTLFLRRPTQPDSRRWLVETLACIERIGRAEFHLAELYASEPQLRRLFPDNRNIRPKLRQQLQVLRDEGVLVLLGNGTYCLASRST